MTKKKEKLDLEIDDLRGEVEEKKLTRDTKELLKDMVETITEDREEKDEWKAIVKSLTDKTKNKTWVGIPIYDENDKKIREEHKELSDVTGAEFKRWVNDVYPPAKKLNHKAEDYDKNAVRENSFLAIISTLRSLQFPTPD